MKKNLTKIFMLALTLCMMIAVFAVVASAAEHIDVVALESTTVPYNGGVQKPVIVSYASGTAEIIALDDERVTAGGDAAFKNAGVYDITVKLNSKEYNLRYEITKVKPVLTLGKYSDVKLKDLTYTGVKAAGFWGGFNKFVDANGKTVTLVTGTAKPVITTTYYDAEANVVTPITVGAYKVVFTTAETENFLAADAATYDIAITPKEIALNVENISKIYGEDDPKIAMPEGALFDCDLGLVEIAYKREAGENAKVYNITEFYLVGDAAKNYKVVSTGAQTLTIEKFAVTIIVGEHTITYGDELVLNNYSFKNGVGFFAEDGIEVVLSPIDLAAQVGTYYLEAEVVGAAAANYEVDYDYENAILVLEARVLTAADFVLDNNVLNYNGQLQLPTVLLADGALGAFGDAECGLEVIGSARKYGGTYYVTVVALKNENYVLADDVRLEYTILAEGEKNSDNAVGEFLAGVINAGEIVGEVVEVVAPVVNAIGKVIIDGIKNGVSALLNDFIGRVFA